MLRERGFDSLTRYHPTGVLMARPATEKAPMKPVRKGMRRKGCDPSKPRVVRGANGSVTYYAPIIADVEDEAVQVEEEPVPAYELDPCPFCRGRARMEHFLGYHVECVRCGTYTKDYDTAYQAAKRWNKRSGQDSANPKTRKLKAAKAQKPSEPRGQTTFDFMGLLNRSGAGSNPADPVPGR